MIAAAKHVVKRFWPSLRLRTILFGTLLFTAALPGFGALFLRVYENTLVRQSEAELVAQGAALVAAAEVAWPGAPLSPAPVRYRPEPSAIDLRASPILGERPPGRPGAQLPDAAAVAMAAEVGPVAERTAITTLASIQFVDRTGIVVHGFERGTSYAAVPEVAAALRGQTRTVFRRNAAYRPVYAFEWLSRASALRLHHVRPIFVGGKVAGAVVLSRSPRALFRGLYEDRGKILFGIAAIFGLLVVMTGLLSRGIARPIVALGEATRGVAAGRGSVPDPPVTAAIEIRELFANFRVMAEAIERRSGYLRDFAAAVSHEFKTPLAGLAGAIELLEDHADTMSAAERTRFLNNMRADAGRLSLLVTRLLDLARADMTEGGVDASTDAAALVRRLAAAWRADGFAVTVAVPEVLFAVEIREEALQSVLETLITNSRQAGASAVEIALSRAEAAVEIAVADNGHGIAPADRARLFEAFFTTRRDKGGTGLGLPIAASLLRAYRGAIALDDAPSGARFVIRLPVA